ncbi:MAG: sigma-70 family RNA polymerase sigma factor [Deltaproteobacteria bacterium]|nr:sigma-70 family RNA polymerase sigma factor [Deltaproteobacteria bacterium]
MKVGPANSATSDTPRHQVVFLDPAHAIVDGLKRKDPNALSDLFDAYAPLIQKILARIPGADHFELEDCLQDTFISAFKNAKQLQEPGFLKSWLTRIAIHRAVDELRKRKRGSWLQFSSPEALPAIPVAPSCFEDQEAIAAVYDVLASLPAKQRVVFTLRRLEKMTISEIAAACDISEATVKRRITTAQARFEKKVRATPALENWLSDNGLWREK